MNKEKVVLEIDDREDKKIFNSLSTEKFREFISNLKVDVDINKSRLEVGDFVVMEKNLCIERKSFADFVGSMRQGRLYIQLLNMEANFERNYLIISGNIKDCADNPYLESYSVNEYIGSIASILARFNVKMFIVNTDAQLLKLVLKIVEKSYGSKTIPIINRIKRSKDDVKLAMLLQIPRLGEKKARLILEKYSLKDLAYLDLPDLMEINGVGKKIGNYVLEVFK